MSSKVTECGVCNYRKISKPSVVWCSECDEGLCEECKEHHTASKATRSHSIVLQSDYQKLPSDILKFTTTCLEHDEKYVIFCKKHDSPCCSRCVVETHNDCKDLNAIDDVIKNVKSSSAFLEMEQMLTELSENLQKIRKDRQLNIESLTENRTKIEKEFQQTRSLIDKHLDKLQESLIKELYDTEEKESTKIKNIISSIQENERKITECKSTLDRIKLHASDLQTFLAMKHIQQDVRNNEHFLESLIKEKEMNNVSITWKNESALEIIPVQIKKMGTIILDIRSGNATLTNRKNTQAQIMMPITHVTSIDDIKLTLIQTVKTIGGDIKSCCLLPDGRMIFSCYLSNKIHVFKTSGTFDFTLETGSLTSHIHLIGQSQKLVVTTGNYNQCIMIINMKNRKTEKSIDVGSEIYGIVHKDGQLFYNGYDEGLCVVSLDGSVKFIKRLINVTLKQNSSIAICSNQLYFIGEDDSISCCDLQGDVKWKLEQKTFLSNVRGITVDNYGHVYVSGFWSHNVVVISPDGNKHRLLLSEKDGLQSPQSLFFDPINNKLLITNQQTNAFVYYVSK
ncbi:E3 ubiquitin-protein ligase TRIM71-like [Mytilus edulis]|uniref:E3 ubiquitin-protein ligase TRIM71-like n=1 Tax=Mytilus edulis TaxID=6550 RepID=UPI0039EDEBF5